MEPKDVIAVRWEDIGWQDLPDISTVFERDGQEYRFFGAYEGFVFLERMEATDEAT